MIPDFADLRQELEAEAALYIHIQKRADPLLRQIRSLTQHEGEMHSYVQRGKGLKESGYSAFQHELQFNVDEILSLRDDHRTAKLDEIAKSLRDQMAGSLFSEIQSECDSVGNSVDANGQPLSKELFLEMIRKTETDFDDQKRPNQTLVLHPDMAEKWLPEAKKWEEDPAFVKEHSSILAEKYEAFRERESCRKLVS